MCGQDENCAAATGCGTFYYGTFYYGTFYYGTIYCGTIYCGTIYCGTIYYGTIAFVPSLSAILLCLNHLIFLLFTVYIFIYSFITRQCLAYIVSNIDTLDSLVQRK